MNQPDHNKPIAPLVYVIVLNWNGIEHLAECFSSLYHLEYSNTRFVLVDNGSRDGSIDFVKTHFPGVKIIALQKNIGFAAGNNRGMDFALSQGANYVALLNNDTTVHPRWISELVAAAEADPEVGICATKMLYYSNPFIINGVGVVMNKLCNCWDKYNGRFVDSVRKAEDILAACGGAFFVRATCLHEAGMFDPCYFIYLEDVDLCIRIRQRGYKILSVPQAIIYHKFSATMKEGSPWKNYLILRNRLRLLLKLLPSDMVRYALPRIIHHEIRVAKNWFRNREFKRNIYQLKALSVTALNMVSIYRLRRRLKNARRFFDRESIYPTDYPPSHVPLYYPSRIEANDLTSRLYMGINDQGLGYGWFALENDCSSIMNYRRMSKEATLSLINHFAGIQYIQIQVARAIHGNTPAALTIFWNGEVVGSVKPDNYWRTFCLKAELLPGRGELLLKADDVVLDIQGGSLIDTSFKIAEISILEAGSVFLREEEF